MKKIILLIIMILLILPKTVDAKIRHRHTIKIRRSSHKKIVSRKNSDRRRIYSINVRSTAYCMCRHRCASGCKPTPQTIAISKDLERRGIKLGDVVYVNGEKKIVHDRMSLKKHNHIDIFVSNCHKAKQYGVKYIQIVWTPKTAGRRRVYEN